MGLKCKIELGPNQLPVAVTEQGNISPLFKGFLDMFSDLDAKQQHNKAIVFWTAASDERFQNYTGKNEDTAVVEDVIAYVQAKNMFDNELSASEEFEVKKMMSASGVRSLGELAQKLATIFPAGKIDTKSAIESGIYTQEDINSLEIGKIIPVIDRIYGSIMKDKDFEVESKDTIETYRNSQEKSILGASSVVTLSEVQEQLLKQVSDPRDVKEIEKVLSEMPFDEIYNKFKEDQEFAKDFLEFFQGLRRLEVSSIVGDELVVESKRKATMRNTFPVPETTLPFKAISEYIANIPEIVFTTSLPQVREILTRTEEDFAEIGVDVVGLKDLQSQSQILDVLNTAVQALEQGQPDMLAEKLDEIFGEQDNTVIKRIDNEFDDITLVVLNTTLSPLEVFKRFGLIKLNSNVYQKISTTEDLQNAYDLLTERVQQGELEIPSPHKTYTSKKDTTTIQENLKTWMKTKDTGLGFKDERASLYQAVFKHKPQRDTKAKDILLLDSVNTRDEAYLTQDFISDFYSYILKEKVKDSTLYKDVLSKFDVTDNEITLNGDLISLDGIEFKQTLEDYIRLSKNPSLKHLVSKKGETQNNSNLTALNNKEAIAEYNQPMRKEGNYIVTKPNTADYIRKGQDVYEKVAQNKNGSVYGLVSPQENPSFYTTKYEVANDKKEIERLLRTADLLFKDTETFSQKERKAGMLTPFFQNLKRKAEGVFQVGQTQEQVRFQQDDLSQRAATPFSNLAGMTTAIGNAIKENPVTFNSDGRISGAYIDFKVYAQQQDKKESVSTPTSLPFLPNVLTLKHQVKEIEAKKDILENGFKIDMDTESPIPGVYLSSEDWGRMDRFGAIKGEEIYVDVNNEGLVYFDSVREFVDFLKSNDIPYQGQILTERHIQQLKDKGIKGILLREDFASQAKNELIIIDTNIITNTTTVKKEITKLPPSFSEHEDIARLYLDQKSKNITSEFTQAVEKYIKQPQLQIIGSNNALTTEDNKTLKQAQELSRRGASKEEIYSQTRWLQTNQGQWVREIGDLKFIPTNKEALKEDVEYLYNNKRAEYNLNEWFDFSEFKTKTDYTNTEFVVEYKESKENNVYGKATKSKTGDYKITVKIEGTKDFIGKVLGGRSYGVDTIRRFDDNGGASETTVRLEKSLESLVNHELQHILQSDGRRKVGNSTEAVLDYFARKNRSVIEKASPRTYQELSEILGKIYNKPNFTEYAEGLYRNSIGERQATEVERRLSNKEGLPEDFSGAYNIDITDMSSDELNFQIISERGAQNVEAYKELLDEAKRLEAQGVSLPEIENKTGWYKFKGQWRRMSQEALKDFTIKNNTVNKVLTLKEVLGNENTIFTFYPEMDKIKVVFLDTTQPLNGIEVPVGAEQANGWYSKRDLTIFINRNLTENERHETYVLGHEVSHAIQEIEGLPKGGWMDSVLEETKIILGIQEEEGPTIELYNAILAADKTNLTPNQQKIVQDSMITLLSLAQGDRRTLIRQYRHIVGEIDAKVVEEALKARDRGNVTMNYSDFLKVWVNQENIDLNNVYLLGNGEVQFLIDQDGVQRGRSFVIKKSPDEIATMVKSSSQTTLGEIFDLSSAQQLIEKTDLSNIPITFTHESTSNTEATALLDISANGIEGIRINSSNSDFRQGNDRFRNELAVLIAHELQHIYDIEKGIPSGTNVDEVARELQKHKGDILRNFTSSIERTEQRPLISKESAVSVGVYLAVRGEQRARLNALQELGVDPELMNSYEPVIQEELLISGVEDIKNIKEEDIPKYEQIGINYFYETTSPTKEGLEYPNTTIGLEETKQIIQKLKESGLSNNTYILTPQQIQDKLQEIGIIDPEIQRQIGEVLEFLRVFHGTSKDKDFKKFKDGQKGVFVTTSAEAASQYAEDNDSVRYGDYNHVTGTFEQINTMSRVIPLKMLVEGKSIYKLTEEDLKFLNSSPNYAKQQRELHPKIKLQGYDIIDYGNGNYAILSPNTLLNSLTNEVQFQKQLAENGITLTTTGFVYQGDVYLNEATLNPNTAIHEFNHLFTDWLKTNRPEIFNRGLELVNKEISKNNSDIQDTIDFVRRNQPNLTGENFALEVLTQLVGERGQSIIESKKKTGLKSWLQDLWNEIKQLLGILDITPQQLSKLTLQEYADKMAIQLLKGEDTTKSNIQQAIQRNNGNPLTLAPNGQPSILYQSYIGLGYTDTEAQNLVAQVYSDNFINWFGDWINDPQNASKVVDENGQPLVVYHGTESRTGFTEFKKGRGRSSGMAIFGEGMYFSDSKDIAGKWGFKAQSGVDKAMGVAPRVIPSFLNLRNPNEMLGLKSQYPKNSEELGFDGVIAEVNLGENLEFVAFNPNQIKSATENIGTFSPESNDIRYQIIGEKGASQLDAYEESSIRIDNLKIARQMEESLGLKVYDRQTGRKRDEKLRILMATGWQRNADLSWGYEIDNSKAQLNLSVDMLSQEGEKHNLDSVLIFDEFYQAFPEARNIKVSFSDKLEDNADAQILGDEIILGVTKEDIRKEITNNEAKKSWQRKLDTLIDASEISKDNTYVHTIAGRAMLILKDVGQLKQFFLKDLDNQDDIHQAMINLTKESFTKDSKKRDQDRKDYISLLKKQSPLVRKLLPSLLHEAQHWVQQKEGFLSGSNLSRVATSLKRKERETYRKLYEESKRLKNELEKQGIDWFRQEQSIIDTIEAPYNFLFDRYKRGMGETQARNVQKRMNLTPEQRRETLFEDTEDVAREDQIFLRSGITGQQFAFVQKSIESQSLEKDFIQNSGFTLLSLAENQEELINEFDNCD